MAEEKKLTVGIVGLGLIGGSLAKAAKEGTHHTVLIFLLARNRNQPQVMKNEKKRIREKKNGSG